MAIKVLNQSVADKIAAGEVCERPSSVCKELVENSIDAGATKITVEIKNGGIEYIRVADNGCGIESGEAELAFLRHATSKLQSIEDLNSLGTMGFRGEALASICAVAKVEVLTKTKDAQLGTYLVMEGGKPKEKEEIACATGTTMIIEDLFANVPARMKFMKKNSTEAGYVADVLGRIALARPDISMEFINDGKSVFKTNGDGNIKNAVLMIYGIECAKALVDVFYEKNGTKVFGVVGKPEISRGNRTRQTLFVNRRYIKNHVVSKVVEEAYRNAVMVGKFPFFVLGIDISPELVDVNVHPAKTEIKFANEKEVYDTVFYAVKTALFSEKEQKTNVSAEYKKTEEPKAQSVQLSMNFGENKSGGETFLPKENSRTFGENVQKNTFSFKESAENQRIAPDFTEKFIEYTTPPQNLKGGTGAFFESLNTPFAEAKQEINKTEEDKSDLSTQKTFDAEKIGEEIKITEDSAPPPRVIGQLFETYVIFEKQGSMFLADQHAVHERVRFERLLEQKNKNESFAQVLLDPIVLDLDPSEKMIMQDNLEFFEEYGFDITDFGGGSYIIQKTPVITSDKEIKNLVFEILGFLKSGRKGGMLSLNERTLDSIACKYAVKANKKLSPQEMEKVVFDLFELKKKGITTCPHGRPLLIEFTKYDIEKLFKRIV